MTTTTKLPIEQVNSLLESFQKGELTQEEAHVKMKEILDSIKVEK